MTDNPRPHSRKKAALIIGLMFAIFLLPYFYVLYIYNTGEIPTSKTNEKGVFFKPFISMEGHRYHLLDGGETWVPTSLDGKWAFLNFADSHCDRLCLERIFNSQQAIPTLTQYKGRVEQIVLIHPEHEVGEDLNTIVHLKKNVHSVINASLFASIKQQIASDSLSSYIAIVDSQQQLLLWYGPEQSIEELLRDTKRLLKSAEGEFTDPRRHRPEAERE